jgi:hypothetical protein
MVKSTNESGNAASPGFTDLQEGDVIVYLNKGPFLDTSEPTTLFEFGINEVFGMELTSSIDSFYRYGYVIVADRVGYREVAPLTGNEIVTIRYGNNYMSSSSPLKLVHFNIYDMEEVALSDQHRDKFTNKAIKLHIIEAPFFLSYNYREWSRFFGKDLGNGQQERVKINKIFESHLKNDLKVNEDLISLNLLDMSTEMYWGIPYWKPQKTFSYLLQFARDADGFGNVKFFTTTNLDEESIVLNLKSTSQMFNEKTSSIYSLVNVGPIASALDNAGQLFSRTINHIFEYEIVSYDLVSLVSGLAGGNLYNYDYETSQRFIHTDDYTSSNRHEKYFGQFGLWTEEISNWQSKSYEIGPWPRQIAKDYLNNKIIKQKYQLKCVARAYLNQDRNAGDKVFVSFPSVSSAINKQREFDEQMSGEWIIQEMTDIIMNGVGYSVLSFIKDSFFNTPQADIGGNKEKLPEVTPVKKVNTLTPQRNNGG